jgi:hypothetical protein
LRNGRTALNSVQVTAHNRSREPAVQTILANEQPTDDEVAAALAAVQALLSAEQPGPENAPVAQGWSNSAKLGVQKLRPAKLQTAPRWHTIERLRRAIGGRYDVRSF